MSKVNLPILLGGLLVVLPMVALFAVSFGNDPHARPSALIGTKAHDFQLVDLDGNTVTLDQFAGEPVILNFWSTWCGPCKLEHPYLLQAARANPDVHFLGVIYSDDTTKVRTYLARAGTAYPHLIDEDSRTAIDYGVTGVPESFFIDRSGTIVHKENGPLSPPVIRQMIAQVRR